MLTAGVTMLGSSTENGENHASTAKTTKRVAMRYVR
jgi:hypothetical protein